MIRRCLIIDTESSGLDSEKNGILEVAAILYSVINRTILMQFSTLLALREGQIIDPIATVINRIPTEALIEIDSIWPGLHEDAKIILLQMADKSDCIVAHNAEHDKGFLCQIGCADIAPWICTADDFEWPKSQSRSRERLTQIAIAYGVPVVDAHRALDDCKLIAALFDRRDDLQEAFELAMRPKNLYVANVSYEDRQPAKDAGFIWNEIVPRKWAKKLTVEQAGALPFPVSRVILV